MISHKVKYEIFDGRLVPGHDPLMAIIVVSSDSMAYGQVTFGIPETQSYDSLTSQIFKVDAPAGIDDRWMRTGDDLCTVDVLKFTGLLVSSTEFSITFKFLPSLLSAMNGEFYGLEFYLTLNNEIESIMSPKLIVKIKDRLVTT